ncbi:MAG: TonB-dependent receptor [Rhodothalassiaceae bacterium]|nr:MAG: TonB-dependent receptor [Rhodothalassiaceae bacterium]
MRGGGASLMVLMLLAAAPLPAAADAQQHEHAHGPIEEIVVTANPLATRRAEALQGTSVVSDEELQQALAPTLGETLKALPGISQTFFGAGASRPVIRGLAGDRMRVLVNGLDTIDASTTSPDHAVAGDVATVDRIEVVRGPASLIYGANAIAGVVNMIDDRVPRETPGKAAEGFARFVYGSDDDLVSPSGALTVGLGSHLVAHAQGFFRDTGDYEVPGFLRSRRLRALDPRPIAEEPRGRAINSDQRNWSAGAGLSWVDEAGFVGAAFTNNENNYGIPVALEGEEPGVRIDSSQQRVDVLGGRANPLPGIARADLRFAWGDYDQAEIEDGVVGTRFANEGYEGRLDFVHEPIGALEGSFGLQIRKRDFSATGEEAFVPPTKTRQWGLYLFERLRALARLTLEGGIRLDRQESRAPALGVLRHFTGLSVSGGALIELGNGWHAGLNAFRVERAPTPEELFSDGPHLATFTFERGDVTLGEETARGGELSLKRITGRVTGSVNVFYYRYKDFIAERLTGTVEDDLPVVQFAATPARLVGAEIELEADLWRGEGRALHAQLSGDIVRARDLGLGRPLPRIPPMKARLALEYLGRLFDAGIEATVANHQRRIAAQELPTPGYVDLGLHWRAHPFADPRIAILVEARNLLDEEIRYHTSFLKDLLPAPGRTIRVTLRYDY